MKYALIIITILVCSCNQITKGRVVAKDFEEGHYYTTTETAYGPKGSFQVPVQKYEPARYIIIVEGEYEAETRRERWEINKPQWDTLRQGSYWCLNCRSENY